MTASDWAELIQDLDKEKQLALAHSFEMMAVALVITMKTPEGDLVTRVLGRGDVDALNGSFEHLGITAAEATKLRKSH